MFVVVIEEIQHLDNLVLVFSTYAGNILAPAIQLLNAPARNPFNGQLTFRKLFFFMFWLV